MKKKSLILTGLSLVLLCGGSLTPISVLAQDNITTTTISESSTTTSENQTVAQTTTLPTTETSITTSLTPSSSTSTETTQPTTSTVTTSPSTQEIVSQDEAAQATITIYRLYNPRNGEHLYTADANEKNVLFQKHGWGYEGEAWYAPNKGNGSLPVYRLYNAGLQNHLYTVDTNEVRVLTTKHGWQKDNGGKPVFYSGGTANIFRVYNPKLRGLHHWTTDQNEYRVLPKHGWFQEGIKLKALRVGVPIRTQFSDGLPSGSQTIANTPAHYAIEADVSLQGKGTGYHAKLTMNTPTSAISFGMQFDSAARAPHTGKTAFMVENIGHNYAGGQSYQWTNLYSHNPGKSYRLLLAVQKDGSYAGYINGAKVITGRNAALANQVLAPRVEGAARKSGDSIQANFSNIKIRYNGSYSASRVWTGTPRFNIRNGLTTKLNGQVVPNNASGDRPVHQNVNISGTLTGLPGHADWDTAGFFDKVSGLVQFY
ncbi:hypothetical protein [Streptococcus ovis]|uniref:hypothetical protein n=1 Tax=Streptococcus ovis TaxID=82806 RepID=UPI00035E8A34|nr:hypothetical protein [Streptococcus ovis]